MNDLIASILASGEFVGAPAACACFTAIVATVAARRMSVPAMALGLNFVQNITLRVPLMRARVEPATADPEAAALWTAAANPTGAALTELAETAPMIATADEVIPRLAKNVRNFSTARLTRVFGRVFVDAQSRADLFHILAFKKAEHNGAVIFSPSWDMAASSNGAICAQEADSGSDWFRMDSMCISCSRAWRRR